jgi:GWxTD domain-containing protein
LYKQKRAGKEYKVKKIVLILIALTSVMLAQPENRNATLQENNLLFHIDASAHKSAEPTKTKMDFLAEVPYSSIQFVKKDDGFYGAFEITLSFMDEKKNNVLFEKSWRENIKSADFNQTVSSNNVFFSYRFFDLVPGKYFLKCFVEDLDSKQTAIKDLTLNVKKFSDSLDVSEIVFISEIIKDPAGDRIVPNPSGAVSDKSKSLQFHFEVYSDKEQQVYLEYSLTDFKKEVSFKQEDPQLVKAGANTIIHTINNLSFSVGEYLLKITLKNKDWKEVSSVEKKFQSKIYGIPSSIDDLDKAIDQMKYIALSEELDFIKDEKKYDEKLKKFIAFWDKKKPNPKVEENPIMYEYYRRVEYANKTFKGLSSGWRSDMGMVYITLGPPSNVERHPFESDSKPYEIWQYYELNYTFVFIDQTGFGDYRLYDPDYSRWPGYRQ